MRPSLHLFYFNPTSNHFEASFTFRTNFMNNKRIVRQVSSNVTTHIRCMSVSYGRSHRHVDPEENVSQVSTISPTRQRNPLDSFFNRKREISLSDVDDVFLI